MTVLHNPIQSSQSGGDPACSISREHVDDVAAFAVDGMMVWAVVASIAYWTVLLLRLPGGCWFPICAALAVLAIGLLRQRGFSRPTLCVDKWTLTLFLLCLASAAVSAFTNVPNSDDIAFLHRAILAAANLDQPFQRGDTLHDLPGLPPLTPLHVFTSVEVTTALFARALHVPQILAVHQGLGTLVNFMVPLVYFLLLRFCRVSVPAAVLGTFVVLLAFAASGNADRDWGNFTLLRSWQGKCILAALMVPLCLLWSMRFVQSGGRDDWWRLHAVNVAGIGLSGTGLFLMPFVIGLAAAGAWLASGTECAAGRRMCMSATVLLFPALVAALPWVGLLPKIGDISFYVTGGWPTTCVGSLTLVFDVRGLILDFTLLSVVLVLGRGRPEICGLSAYLLLAALLVLVPGPCDALLRIVTPGAYWRLAYAFVVPLWAGLAAAMLFRFAGSQGWRRSLAAVTAVVLTLEAAWAKVPALTISTLAWPGSKFLPQDLAAVEKIAQVTPHGAVVLADYRVVSVLGLVRPDIKFIVTRQSDTDIAFSSAGKKTEGELRTAVLAAFATCNFSKLPSINIAQTWPDVQEVIVPAPCEPGLVRRALVLDENWRESIMLDYRVWTLR